MVFPTCSICGPCDKGTKECFKGKGKVRQFFDVKHSVLKREPFNCLFDKYYLHWLKRFKMLYWKIKIQGKRWLNLPCLNSLDVTNATIEHDFTAATAVAV